MKIPSIYIHIYIYIHSIYLVYMVYIFQYLKSNLEYAKARNPKLNKKNYETFEQNLGVLILSAWKLITLNDNTIN